MFISSPCTAFESSCDRIEISSLDVVLSHFSSCLGHGFFRLQGQLLASRAKPQEWRASSERFPSLHSHRPQRSPFKSFKIFQINPKAFASSMAATMCSLFLAFVAKANLAWQLCRIFNCECLRLKRCHSSLCTPWSASSCRPLAKFSTSSESASLESLAMACKRSSSRAAWSLKRLILKYV